MTRTGIGYVHMLCTYPSMSQSYKLHLSYLCYLPASSYSFLLDKSNPLLSSLLCPCFIPLSSSGALFLYGPFSTLNWMLSSVACRSSFLPYTFSMAYIHARDVHIYCNGGFICKTVGGNSFICDIRACESSLRLLHGLCFTNRSQVFIK